MKPPNSVRLAEPAQTKTTAICTHRPVTRRGSNRLLPAMAPEPVTAKMNSMSRDSQKIRRAFERNAKALTLKPTRGQGTAVTKVRVREGLTCDITEGPWKLTADLSEKSGGNGAGPNPGALGRAALGSCLAMTYVMWAAKYGVPLSALEVEVQADYDSRGTHGIGGVSPGYQEVRYLVTIESDAPEADILRLLDEADRHTTYLDVFRNPQNVRREVRIQAPGTAARAQAPAPAPPDDRTLQTGPAPASAQARSNSTDRGRKGR